MQTMTEPVLHITTIAAWTAAQREGVYRTSTLEDEGFIHLSNPDQVTEVADVLYRGRTDLVLLCINPTGSPPSCVTKPSRPTRRFRTFTGR